MEINNIAKYNNYVQRLAKIGVEPRILASSAVISSATFKNNDDDFETKNIISGPFGELIKINYDERNIEIYSLEQDNFMRKVIDMDDENHMEVTIFNYDLIEDINFFGHFIFNKLLDIEEKDYSAVRREVFKDKIKFSMIRQEENNKLVRDELDMLKSDISKYMRDFYAHDGVRKIIDKIDSIKNLKEEFKPFETDKVSRDTLWLINNKLKLDFLEEETEKFSSIDVFPLIDLIDDYSKYDREDTNKIVKRLTKVMNSVYDRVSVYTKNKDKIFSNRQYSDKEIKTLKRHSLLYIRRSKEIRKGEDK